MFKVAFYIEIENSNPVNQREWGTIQIFRNEFRCTSKETAEWYLDQVSLLPNFTGGQIEEFINKEIGWVIVE